MTELRQRMDDAMVLRGFALRTRETYLACVAGLAKHYHCSPDRLNAEQIQAYLLHLITEKKLAYASVNQAACACRFLFGNVLQQRKIWLDIPMAKVPKRLPVVLAREDIGRLFAACGNLRTRTVLMTTYAAGLRVSEVCALQLGDIESAPDRMCLKVRQGKGGQDRYSLLSPDCWTPCACTGRPADRASGCSPTRPVTAPCSTKPLSACTGPPAMRPDSPTPPASTPCATASPPTYWKPG
jgi:site-specific recombinase XerD